MFVQGTLTVGYSPPYIYYELLIVLITQSYQSVAEASSSFKWLGMCTSTSTMPIFNYITNNLKPFIYSPSQLFFSMAQYVYVHVCTPIFITEALHFVTQVQWILMTVTALAYSYWVSFHDAL